MFLSLTKNNENKSLKQILLRYFKMINLEQIHFLYWMTLSSLNIFFKVLLMGSKQLKVYQHHLYFYYKPVIIAFTQLFLYAEPWAAKWTK